MLDFISHGNVQEHDYENFFAMFLDSMTKVIEIDTSKIFLGHLRKFQSVYDEARISVKKRIESKV